jgi:hypothetical protein
MKRADVAHVRHAPDGHVHVFLTVARTELPGLETFNRHELQYLKLAVR